MSRARETGSWATSARRVLAENGHRTGQARDALVGLLDAQPCARSVLEIEDSLRSGKRPIARASIYRILDELERLHLVQKVQLGQEMARYEPVRGGEGHHHHLVCDNCGTLTPFTDEDLETAIRRLSSRLPMQVAEHEIVLHGACADCTSS
ncbi:MAG TPA: Fur family transcriptional regulator [Solirubrobacteraceae bacterium]|jgi:Fur family ferric uptake transcriptional regulator